MQDSGSAAASAQALAEALAARICHDLSSPVGTLAGAMEMARETADPEALALAADVAAELAARLRLLRAAWGGGAGAMPAADLIGLLAPLAASRRARLEGHGLSGRFSPARAVLVLNLAMLGLEALRGAGTLTLGGDAAQGVTLRIAGRFAAWPEGARESLAGKAAGAATPRDIVQRLLPAFATAAGAQLGLESGPSGTLRAHWSA